MLCAVVCSMIMFGGVVCSASKGKNGIQSLHRTGKTTNRYWLHQESILAVTQHKKLWQSKWRQDQFLSQLKTIRDYPAGNLGRKQGGMEAEHRWAWVQSVGESNFRYGNRWDWRNEGRSSKAQGRKRSQGSRNASVYAWICRNASAVSVEMHL